MRIDDPIGYRQEVLAEFVSGISTLLDPVAIDACVRGEKELAPQPGIEYRGFADLGGGRHDASTFCVGHLDAEGNAVIDVLRRIEAPHVPAFAVDEFVARCRGRPDANLDHPPVVPTEIVR